MPHSIVLVPFVLAFLVFMVRFYVRESASSIRNPSFVMAIATVLSMVLYVVLDRHSDLVSYGVLGFGALGLAWLTTAVVLMVRI